MRRVILHELVEDPETLSIGPAVGQIVFRADGPHAQMSTAARREQIERILAEPVKLVGGDPTGATLSTTVRYLTWEDGDDFIAALIARLWEPDVRLQGELLDG